MTKTTTRLIGTVVGSTAIALASAAIATPAFAQTVSTDNGSIMTSASGMNTNGAMITPYPPNINFLTLGGGSGGFGGNGLFGGNNGLFGGSGGLNGNYGYSPFDRAFALGQLFSGGYGSGLLSNVGGVTLGNLAVLSQFFNH